MIAFLLWLSESPVRCPNASPRPAAVRSGPPGSPRAPPRLGARSLPRGRPPRRRHGTARPGAGRVTRFLLQGGSPTEILLNELEGVEGLSPRGLVGWGAKAEAPPGALREAASPAQTLRGGAGGPWVSSIGSEPQPLSIRTAKDTVLRAGTVLFLFV